MHIAMLISTTYRCIVINCLLLIPINKFWYCWALLHVLPAVFYYHSQTVHNFYYYLTSNVSTLYVYHPTGQWNSKMYFITILRNKWSICRYNIHLCRRLACWADYERTIQVESGNLQSQQIPGVPSHHKPIQALIIFKTHPIRLMASMIIDKHVRL